MPGSLWMISVIVAPPWPQCGRTNNYLTVGPGVNTNTGHQPTVLSSHRANTSVSQSCLTSQIFINGFGFYTRVGWTPSFLSGLVYFQSNSVCQWLAVGGVTANNCFSVSLSFQPEETRRHSRVRGN